jgi:hypothetical protein
MICRSYLRVGVGVTATVALLTLGIPVVLPLLPSAIYR